MSVLSVLVVDDEEPSRRLLRKALSPEFRSEEAAHGEKALELLETQAFNVVLLDQRMPGMSGIETLREIRERFPETHVIMVTAVDDLTFVIECIRAGAEDYMVKPIVVDAMRRKIRALGERQSLAAENRRLRAELDQRSRFEDMIGESPAFLEMLAELERVSELPIPVLIHGESGTGKELVARSIHRNSPRRSHAFLSINCAAVQGDILASELFGHVKGAFTGAHEAKKGLFAATDGGTLFMDEIGEISPAFQAQLLRVLEDGEILPVGSTAPSSVDTRVVAATNRDLEKEVREGRFRMDLFYRLWKVPIRVPPLRERGKDVVLLAKHFLRRYTTELSKRDHGISEEAQRRLLTYSWPGNVRELQNVVERAVIHHGGKILQPEDLSLGSRRPEARDEVDLLAGTWREARARFEKAYIERALLDTGGNVSQSARSADLDRRNFRDKMNAHRIEIDPAKRTRGDQR